MHQCNKSKEIDAMQKVIYGKKGLITMTSDLFNKMDSLNHSINTIHADVKVLLQFQTQVETKEQQNEKFENKIEKLKEGEVVNKRWRIGLAISTLLGMLAIVVSLLTIVYTEPKEDFSKGVTDKEFEQLWEDYKDKNNIRGLVVFEKDTNN